MRVLIQRASEASVKIDGKIHGEIKGGLVVFLGIEAEDSQDDINWLVRKLIALRIFNDNEGKMNDSIADVNGEFLVISQFTLHASTKKGNRPSYIKASRPEVAIPLYEEFIRILRKESALKVTTGEFGADMKVQLVNDGPVTIWIDSKNRE
ncbi:MAG: D-aminoacyl-tRNA deacylase [Crocinitomicaceae bacterium]|nr:D-aminoacyl-tRNA deacylase [Crocinitomicaceae bacterium]